MTIREFIRSQPARERVKVYAPGLPADGILFDGAIIDLKTVDTLQRLEVRRFYWPENDGLIISVNPSEKEYKTWLYAATE